MLKTLFENATHSKKRNIVTYKNANFNQVIYILCKKGSNFWLSDFSIKCTLLGQSFGQDLLKSCLQVFFAILPPSYDYYKLLAHGPYLVFLYLFFRP
jgi:hypothetical protein